MRAIRMILAGTTLALALCGCGNAPSSSAPSAAAPSAPASSGATNAKHFHLEGTIVSVNKDQKSVVVNHKDIPGFMAAMTMAYPVAVDDAQMLDQLMPGDQITADVEVDDSGARLTQIMITKKASGAPATPTSLEAPPLQQAVPNFALLNQDGKTVNIDQYRGKAVLLTFIYTRCPLPTYCPLMTHNFVTIEKKLEQQPSVYAKTHLLSISFDPSFDTPDILRNYAHGYGQDKFDHWEFTNLPAPETLQVTKFFDLFLSQQGDQVIHSMATAIISPDGRLYKFYPDNDWKPAQALTDLTAAASEGLPRS